MQSDQDRENRRSRVALTIAIVSGMLLVLGICIPLVVRTYRVPTGSMIPTIRDGEHVVVYRLAYRSKSPQRGDIVAYRDGDRTYMHRIIGLPGDTLRIESRRVFVNEARLEEPYVLHADAVVFPWNPAAPEPYRSRDHLPELKLTADQYFILGDNRERSFDSRFRGPVHRTQIVGKMIYVLRSKL